MSRVHAAAPLVKGKAAEVDPGLWQTWTAFKEQADQAAEILRLAEKQIHEQLGDASVVMVNGVKVATRVIRHVENASWTDDHFRRCHP